MTNIDRWTALECAAVLVLAFAFQQSARSQDNATATSANTAAAAVEPQTANGNVPRLIRFSGIAQDETHNSTTGVVGITFSLYKDQQGGSPLWIETQNVQADANGHYTALLGSASAEGVPLELFSSGEAHWLGVQIQSQPEHARVLLVSVPYALKAHEAETLSGRSITDFVLVNKNAVSSPNAANTPVAGSNGTSGSILPAVNNDDPTNFTGANATQIVGVTQRGIGLGLSATANTRAAVAGTITGKSNTAVYGLASNTSKGSNAAGVTGQANTETGPGVAGYSSGPGGTGVLGVTSDTTGGTGVIGVSSATSGFTSGVFGKSASTSGSGLSGEATATSGTTAGVYGHSASFNGTGVYGTSSGAGVSGVATATTGKATGVAGTIASSSGAGVAGNATAASGYTNGVYGQNSSTSGYGVNGNAIATSGYNVGVYGQTESTSGYGVYGLANATGSSGAGGIGVIGINLGSNGSAGSFGALAGQGLILQGWDSNFTQVFSVDASGNLDISGNLTVAGSKSARVQLQDGREVALYAVESPENWFEDFGTGQLQSGKTEVSLEPGFLQTVDTAAGYHVFLNANGDCRGLYIARKTRGGFEVRELGGGNSSIAFDYRIVARRRGFENVRLQKVHLPQGPKHMRARLASMRSDEHMVAPPPPRATIPVLPHPAAQGH